MKVQEAPLLPSPPQADGFAVALRVALSKYIREHALAINALIDGSGSGVTDHGALTGLADDDHTQYHTDARGDARYSVLAHNHAGVYDPAGTAASAVATHAGEANPHPTYLTQAEADALYSVLAHSHSGLAPVGGSAGQVLKKIDGTNYNYSWQADATGAGGSLSTAAIPFTNGDTVQRVTVTDAAVSAASNILASIRRPDQASAADDRGYLFMPNIVRIGTGEFDAQVVCLGFSGDDVTAIPPNETVTLTYSVA